MRYGKNQQALLDFLYKHPEKYHRIKGEKAIRAARGLQDKLYGIVRTIRLTKSKRFYVGFRLPAILTKQN